MKKYAIVAVLILILLLTACLGASENKINPLGDDGVATVLLDAGHGFGDVGCTSKYMEGKYEYELNLDFTHRLGEKLSALGYNVLFTHDGKSIISEDELCRHADKLGINYDDDKIKRNNNIFDAYERTVYANVLAAENEIDLFISIHVNASASSDTATGFEIDYCAENDYSNISKAAFDSICAKLTEDYQDRILKPFADSWDMAFIVTKYTNMPSLLFETGFASTPSDALLLLDEEWRDSLMQTLSDGIEDFFKKK